MEAILFCGIQGSGKTTFYKQYFFNAHLRISLDLLHTRNKEQQFLLACFAAQQRFVVDNTNPSLAERKRYIDMAKAYKFKIKGYNFVSTVAAAIERNNQRTGKELVPVKGLMATFKKLQPLTYEEGFDELYEVSINNNGFIVKQMFKKPL